MQPNENLKLFVANHARLLAYLGSSLLVSMWTLLRFFTRPTIFDLVGQQVLAGQWLHGFFGGANIGVTNYIPKMLLFYMPLDALPGSPRLKLILLTLVINVATIVLLGVLLEKILREFKIRPNYVFYGALLWLAAIAGSVFWIHFTNSRNLEVVGGVFLLYLGIRYLYRPSWKLLCCLATFGSLLFFADTLQFYMTAMPLLAYAFLTTWRSKGTLKRAGLLSGAMFAGFAVSKLAFALAAQLFSVTFLVAGGGLGVPSAEAAFSTLHALAQLFSGGDDTGKLRMALNLLFIAGASALFLYSVWRRSVSRRLALLVGLVFATNCAVYLLSGQAGQGDTARYLIMTAPAAILAIGALGAGLKKQEKTPVTKILLILVALNALALGVSLAGNWNTAFPKDTHLASVSRYLAHNPWGRAYASMDTALPLTYLGDRNAPLPLSCTADGLIKNRTFYDQAAFSRKEEWSGTVVAIILDGNAITNTPHTCSIDTITSQLGQPASSESTDDGSLVLRYAPTAFRLSPKFN